MKFNLGLLSLGLVCSQAHAFVKNPVPHSAPSYTLGQKILRPQTYTVSRHGFAATTTAGEPETIQRDSRSGAVRFLAGRFPLPRLAPTADLATYSEQARLYLAAHQATFGVAASDLALDPAASYIGPREQFLRFRVYRSGLLVSDASITLRFKLGRLAQVVNRSFAEASAATLPAGVSTEDASGARALLTPILGATEAGRARRLPDTYRVVPEPLGYRLVKVASYESLQADQVGGGLRIQLDLQNRSVFELKDRFYHLGVHVTADAHKRWYNDPLRSKALTGVKLKATADGAWALDGLKGSYIDVRPVRGKAIQRQAEADGNSWALHIESSGSEQPWADPRMAEVMAYYHTTAIRTRALQYIDTPWLHETLPVRVNAPQHCNASWDGETINLFSAGSGCANSALTADVIYHEWGHGLDQMTGGIEDDAFSEGYGDILAIVMTRSPKVGIGFFVETQDPVRDLSKDRVYPRDRGTDVHDEGMIIGSTFWDLYRALAKKYGQAKASDTLARYAFHMIFTTPTYLDAYEAIKLIDDDDDELANGTPNLCLMNKVFVQHGLAEADELCR